MSFRPRRRLLTVHVVLVRRGCEVGVWELDLRADLAAVDALARAQLCARRLGCTVRVRDAAPDLRGLLELVGLAGVVEDGR